MAPGWFENLREEGIGSFEALGFPTTHNEEWKYTNIEPVTSQSFIQARRRRGQRRSRRFIGSILRRYGFPLSDFHQRSVSHRNHSHVESLPNGVRVRSLAEAVRDDDPAVAADFGHYAEHRSHAFTALNTAFLIDGAR